MGSEILVVWLLTLALHASVLLVLAWCADRGGVRARPAWRELLWRVALFGGVVTATAQSLFDLPAFARWNVPGVAAVISATTPVVANERALQISGSSPAVTATEDARSQRVPAAHRDANGSKANSTSLATTNSEASAATAAAMWPQLLFAAWLAGVLLVLARLGVGWLRLERMLAAASPLHDARLEADAALLAAAARIVAPQLAVHDELASPFAARGGRVVMPRWALDLLERAQLHAMLAHETAHLARRDPTWRLAAALCCALLWFLPLSALARRRLDEIAEFACDAWAARRIGDGRSLAECLAECAERHVGGFDTELAPAMARRGSPLLQRIDHLLGGIPLNTTISHARALTAALFALALAAVALPGFATRTALAQPVPPSPPAAPAPPPPPKSDEHHVHISSDLTIFGKKKETTFVEVSDKDRGYSANIHGKIEFNEREDDVASLSGGGSASFAEKQGGSERRVDYTERDGKLEQRYFVDDHEQPLDAAAHTWIAAIIPVVIRETGMNAEARVKRYYDKGGATAVLDEIDRIESSYARGVYLRQLFALGKLSPADVTRVLHVIDGSDSDYERRETLAALAAAAPLDASQQKLVIGQAEKIESDYERAELLIGMLPKLAPDPELRKAWLHAAAAIGSDYEHRRALSALLDTTPLDDATLGEIIGAAKTIGSDYERRELLVDAIRRIGDADRVADAYASAVGDIGSDYERREALLALIRAPKFGATGTRAVLGAAAAVGSDHECSEILVALARSMPNDADLIERYRSVARRLSDFERAAAERALDRFVS